MSPAADDRHERVVRHVDAFNEAVRNGDWAHFAERFSDDALLDFVGVAAGPFRGRDAIAAAYDEQPPTDTLVPTEVAPDGVADVCRFRWSTGGSGRMRLLWRGDLVAELVVSFDDA